MPSPRMLLHCPRLVSLALLATIPACAGLPTDFPRTPSYAFDRPQETALGRFFADDIAAHPGQSGVVPVPLGRTAFTARAAMADMAEHSIDLQYYIWNADTTGRLLAERILLAADRGVRVRVLLDDINVGGRDQAIAALSGHPHVEIRSFNPFADRGKLLDWGLDAGRVNHRMHNKLMVVDGAAAMVGGRNIGDHYFGVDSGSNFRDLDVFTVGPVVSEVNALFDVFWNDEHSIPFAAFVDDPPTAETSRAARKTMLELLEQSEYPYAIDEDIEAIRGQLGDVKQQLIWAPVEALHDTPDKVALGGDVIVERLKQVIRGARREVLLENAYFIPTENGLAIMRDLRERGVTVRVLTNSMVGNDVLAAHAGYADYREEMIAAGVELHELRPDPDVKQRWSRLSTRSRASLHTKALVVDGRHVFIGSFNMDPRSARINTEVGLLVDSPELGAQMAEFLAEGVRPENAYRLLLDDDDDLVWLGVEEGQMVCYDQDPHSSWWQRANAWFLSWLPIEDQL